MISCVAPSSIPAHCFPGTCHISRGKKPGANNTINLIKTRFLVGAMVRYITDQCFPNFPILVWMLWILTIKHFLNEHSLNNSQIKWNSHTHYDLVQLVNWNMKNFFIWSVFKRAYCLSQLVAITTIRNYINYTKLSMETSIKITVSAKNKMMCLVELPDTK